MDLGRGFALSMGRVRRRSDIRAACRAAAVLWSATVVERTPPVRCRAVGQVRGSAKHDRPPPGRRGKPMRAKTVSAIIAAAGLGTVPLLALTVAGPSASSVRLESPAWRDIRPSVFASGQLVHGDSARVTSEVVGMINAVHVTEGQRVARGDLLLEIDGATYAAQIAHHQATVRLREADIERKRLVIARLTSQRRRSGRLYHAGLLDAETYENASHGLRLAELDLVASREALKQARAALAQSEGQFDKTRIVAPLAGVVASLGVEIGETAIAGTTNVTGSVLVEVADPDSLLAEVYVDEADLAGIRVGQSAAVVPVADAGRPLTGEVQFIAETAKFRPNTRSRSFRLRIALTDAAGLALRAGMSCRAEVYLAPAVSALAIPIAAIVSSDEPATGGTRHFVYASRGRQGNGTASVARVEVELGRSDDEFQEVVRGLAADDLIVVGPNGTLRRLRDGDLVVDATE